MRLGYQLISNSLGKLVIAIRVPSTKSYAVTSVVYTTKFLISKFLVFTFTY